MTTPRLLSDHPIKILRTIMDKHCPRLWAAPEELASVIGSGPEMPLTRCFSEWPGINAIDPSQLSVRLVCSSGKAGGREYNVVALLGPDVPGPGLLLVTAEMEALIACETTAAIHPDGTIQIYGAEPGITLFTQRELREQSGRKLMHGTKLFNLALQERAPDGTWSAKSLALTLTPGIVREVHFS